MSKQKKSRSKAVLAVIVIIALIGACFGSVGLYVKFELSKPKFQLPETAQSVTPLPETVSGIYSYISSLCKKADGADNIELSLYTEVWEIGDFTESLFNDSDNAVIKYIMNNALGTVSGMYEEINSVKTSEIKNAPEFIWGEQSVTDASAVHGSYNDSGEFIDDSYYFIHLDFTPDEDEYNADILSEITKAVSPAFCIENCKIKMTGLYADYRVDRFTDNIVNIDITRRYSVSVSAVPAQQYKDLLPEGESSAKITLPYTTTQSLSLNYYGAYFTKPCIAVNKGDVETLPASVTVNSNASDEDYKLSFAVSDADAVKIDEDGVMTVLKNSDKPVTVSMTLEYDGHTYTDNLTVYITELEVETDG